MNLKKQAALHALQYIRSGNVIGLGSGSTMALFIKALGASLKSGELSDIVAVPTSEETAQQAREVGVKLSTLDECERLDVAIDGADEVTSENFLIKGGGGAHTREKIVAAASKEFICIIDKSKLVDKLGSFPLPVEVIPESRSLVSRRIIALGGVPQYREGFITDQGNQIIDIMNLNIIEPEAIEALLNNIPGVVDNGIFAFNKPQVVLVAD